MEQVYQLEVLLFGLSQNDLPMGVLKMHMHVSLPSLMGRGVSILSYLDGWLISASTRQQVILDV